MSYCEVITFKDGKPHESLECRNAWGGAAYIWSALFDRYLKDPRKEYDSWLTAGMFGNDDKRLWKLAERKDLPRFMRAVHASTFDRAIVDNENLKQFASDLRAFVGFFGSGDKVCHLDSWADFIEQHLDVEAIGFYGTSVSENLWHVRIPDDDDDVCRPYDLNSDEDHFEVYEALDEWEQEPVEQE